jgi:hypothetical protein
VLAAIYGSKLAAVIHKMNIISQVAGLARQLEMEADEQVALRKAVTIRDTVFNWNFRGFDGLNDEEEERFDDEGTECPNSSVQPDAMTDEKAAT